MLHYYYYTIMLRIIFYYVLYLYCSMTYKLMYSLITKRCTRIQSSFLIASLQALWRAMRILEARGA